MLGVDRLLPSSTPRSTYVLLIVRQHSHEQQVPPIQSCKVPNGIKGTADSPRFRMQGKRSHRRALKLPKSDVPSHQTKRTIAPLSHIISAELIGKMPPNRTWASPPPVSRGPADDVELGKVRISQQPTSIGQSRAARQIGIPASPVVRTKGRKFCLWGLP